MGDTEGIRVFVSYMMVAVLVYSVIGAAFVAVASGSTVRRNPFFLWVDH